MSKPSLLKGILTYDGAGLREQAFELMLSIMDLVLTSCETALLCRNVMLSRDRLQRAKHFHENLLGGLWSLPSNEGYATYVEEFDWRTIRLETMKGALEQQIRILSKSSHTSQILSFRIPPTKVG